MHRGHEKVRDVREAERRSEPQTQRRLAEDYRGWARIARVCAWCFMVMAGALDLLEACETIPKALSLSSDERVNVRRPSLLPRFQNLRLHFHYSGRQSICASRRAHVALLHLSTSFPDSARIRPDEPEAEECLVTGEDSTVQHMRTKCSALTLAIHRRAFSGPSIFLISSCMKSQPISPNGFICAA